MTRIPDPVELNKPTCPHCGSDKVIRIQRPEVYEYQFLCKRCDRGFN